MQAGPAQLSVEDYLRQELGGIVKHEYVDGELYAMAGASRRHNLLVSNLMRHALNAAARHEGCQVFGSDMKVRVTAHNSFYYPDLSGCCDSSDRDERFLTKPCFIVEVLSPATASVDRREKRLSYERLDSLDEYVIVDQDRMLAYAYRRLGMRWMAYILRDPQDAIEISCLSLRLTLEQVYKGIDLPPPGVSEPEPPDYLPAIND